MRLLILRVGFLTAPLAFAAWLGCSSDTTINSVATDAGSDQAAPVPPPPPPPVDAGVDSGKLDCGRDVQLDGFALHLQCSGLYDDFASKTIAPANKPYKPALEFWSDGAEKSRFLYLPPGTKIDISNFDEWTWPKGTKVWKEFRVGGKRVETRLFQKVDEGVWSRTVYRWNADETDAVKKEDGDKVPVAGKPSYEVPPTSSCDICHQGRHEPILGLEAVNLGLPGATGVTLASLDQDGLLSAPAPQTSFTIPEDPALTAGLAPGALGWLHVNCGVCHNNGTGAAAGVNYRALIRASQLLADGGVTSATGLDVYTTAVRDPNTNECLASSRTQDGGAPWLYVSGGQPQESLISVLSGSRAPEGQQPSTSTQMPPVVSHIVDTVGHQKLDDWITALAPCP